MPDARGASAGPPEYDLRDATPGDLAFLFSLYRDVRGPEVAAWGWPEPQRDVFLRMQFEAQRRSYDAGYPGASHRIVCVDGEPAGRRLAATGPEGIHLVDIALLSGYRNRGIGSSLLRELMDACAAGGKALRLQVLRGNPAARLYERLGFRETDADPVYIRMEWKPGGASAA